MTRRSNLALVLGDHLDWRYFLSRLMSRETPSLVLVSHRGAQRFAHSRFGITVSAEGMSDAFFGIPPSSHDSVSGWKVVFLLTVLPVGHHPKAESISRWLRSGGFPLRATPSTYPHATLGWLPDCVISSEYHHQQSGVVPADLVHGESMLSPDTKPSLSASCQAVPCGSHLAFTTIRTHPPITCTQRHNLGMW